MDDQEDRIIELEIRFAHQDRLIEELNSVLVDFGRRIHQLEKENVHLRETLRGLSPETPESPDE